MVLIFALLGPRHVNCENQPILTFEWRSGWPDQPRHRNRSANIRVIEISDGDDDLSVGHLGTISHAPQRQLSTPEGFTSANEDFHTPL